MIKHKHNTDLHRIISQLDHETCIKFSLFCLKNVKRCSEYKELVNQCIDLVESKQVKTDDIFTIIRNIRGCLCYVALCASATLRTLLDKREAYYAANYAFCAESAQ